MSQTGIRAAMAAVDKDIADSVDKALSAADDFAQEVPLMGLSPQRMHDIEEKGVALCKERLGKIEAELERLAGEAANTKAIIAAGSLKLEMLKKHLGTLKLNQAPSGIVKPNAAEAWTLQNSGERHEDDPNAGITTVGH